MLTWMLDGKVTSVPEIIAGLNVSSLLLAAFPKTITQCPAWGSQTTFQSSAPLPAFAFASVPKLIEVPELVPTIPRQFVLLSK